MIENHDFADIFQEPGVVVELVLSQRVQLLKSRVMKHPDGFGNNLTRNEQSVMPVKQSGQHFASRGTAKRMTPNQHGRVKDDSQPTGL